MGVKFVGSFAVTNSTFGGAVTIPSPPNFVQLGETSTLRFVNPANPLGLATTSFVSIDNPGLSGGCYNGIAIDFANGFEGDPAVASASY